MLQLQRGGNFRRRKKKWKSSDTGSSFQWNYWPKSLTTRASKLAGELSSYYKLMKSYYHQERDYNPFRQTARMDRLIKRSATSAPHLSTGLTAPRWLPFPDILILHGPIPIYKWNSLSRPKRRSFMEGSCSYSDLLHPFILGFTLRLMSSKMMLGDCFCPYCASNYRPLHQSSLKAAASFIDSTRGAKRKRGTCRFPISCTDELVCYISCVYMVDWPASPLLVLISSSCMLCTACWLPHVLIQLLSLLAYRWMSLSLCAWLPDYHVFFIKKREAKAPPMWRTRNSIH